MNGADVFNFVLREIPKDIKQILTYSDKTKEEIDYFVFHQANNYINSYIAKKLKLEKDKVPSTISKFGNTSSVSIPLTIVSELKNKLNLVYPEIRWSKDTMKPQIWFSHINPKLQTNQNNRNNNNVLKFIYETIKITPLFPISKAQPRVRTMTEIRSGPRIASKQRERQDLLMRLSM